MRDQRMGTPRPSKGKIRVLVADREGIFRLGLKKLFAVEDDLRVVAEADKAADVLARGRAFQPDLVFIQEEILAESERQPHLRDYRSWPPSARWSPPHPRQSDETSMRHVRSGAAGVILKIGRSATLRQVRPPCYRRRYVGSQAASFQHGETSRSRAPPLHPALSIL